MTGPLIIYLDGLQLSTKEIDLLLDPLVGGVIFFARNFTSSKQLRNLVQDIRSVCPELLLCVDQEGGRVQRFKEGFTRLPAFGQLTELSDLKGIDIDKLVRMHARVMANELREAGLDFSFTPVVDLDYGHNTVVGDRAFGGDPGYVADLALSYVDEMTRTGMAAVAKHFPGHGYVAEDTHTDVAVDPRQKQQILDTDVLPFKALIDKGVAGIMPAHVIYKEVDANPAVQSYLWIEKILRGELGFKGAVISDDLGMAGAAGAPQIETKVRTAVQAGCDLLMVCNDRIALQRALWTLHQMEVDHLTPVRCARRRSLAIRAEYEPPADFSLARVQQLFQG